MWLGTGAWDWSLEDWGLEDWGGVAVGLILWADFDLLD